MEFMFRAVEKGSGGAGGSAAKKIFHLEWKT